jgi:superfamily I DNA/RNA helicase
MNNGRPDIVVFNPEVGAVIYEVKDWDLNKYYMKSGSLYVKNKTDVLRTPMEQVVYHRTRLIELLSPVIGEAIDKCKSVNNILQTCVYFHKASGNEARDFFHAQDKEIPMIIGNDELTEMNLHNIIPSLSLKGVNRFMTKDFANEISFWLKPPIHSLEGTKKLKLSPKQSKHSEPAEGHHRVRGETGSGKTIVIAYRAAKLASEGKRVLVVSYNTTLQHYIRYLIDQVPIEFNQENINFNHFHGFCKDIIADAGLKSPNSKMKNWMEWSLPDVNNLFEEDMYNDTIRKYRYDAILIDEGHDFQSEWIKCLSRFLGKRNEMLFVCDEKQNIYKRDMNWIEEPKSLFRGRWGELNKVYRLPPLIGEIASSFRINFGLAVTPLECDGFYQTTFDEIGLIPHLVWKNILESDWLENIYSEYTIIKQALSNMQNGHVSDIVILVPTTRKGLRAVKRFEKEKIEINHVFNGNEEENIFLDEIERKKRNHKKSFWVKDGRLKMCTIHSFKGWEAPHVIMLIPDKHTWKSADINHDLDTIVYTAMTRTRMNLIVLNCNDRYSEFGKKYSSTW